MAVPKKKTTKKRIGKAGKQAPQPQHVVAMTYFVLGLALIFLTMIVIRYIVQQ